MSAVSCPDFESLDRFFAASVSQVQKLHECQRHEAARSVVCALSRLVATVRQQAQTHGYLAEIVLGRWPEIICGLSTDSC